MSKRNGATVITQEQEPSSVTTTPQGQGANQHVSNYLSYYLGFERAPTYAVMVAGLWGVGKTHLGHVDKGLPQRD